MLRAWTNPLQMGNNYYLSFGSPDFSDGNISSSNIDYIGLLTPSQANSGAVLITLEGICMGN